jgi:hypothetical protein
MDDSSDGQHLISKFVAKNWTDIFGDTPFSMFQNITPAPMLSVPRINCLDCLDRTNVMMARISESFLYSAAELMSTPGLSRQGSGHAGKANGH